MRKASYKSDVKLGELYRHKRSGYTGYAIAVTFFENACERVQLEASKLNSDGKLVEQLFDAVELENAATGEPATSARTGGVRPSPERREVPGR